MRLSFLHPLFPRPGQSQSRADDSSGDKWCPKTEQAEGGEPGVTVLACTCLALQGCTEADRSSDLTTQ